MDDEQKNNAAKDIQWHPAFVSAMNLELLENREDLVFEREYNLNTKPLEIDLLTGSVYRSKRKVDGTVERRGWNGSGVNENYGA